MQKATPHENLLVTIGCRAGTMDALGHIHVARALHGLDY